MKRSGSIGKRGTALAAAILALLFATASVRHALAQDAGGKITVAVLEFEAPAMISMRARAFSQTVRDALSTEPRYQVLELAEMQERLKSAGLGTLPCADNECALNAGKALGVDRIITGKIELQRGGTWSAAAFYLDVENNASLAGAWVTDKQGGEHFASESAAVLAARLIKAEAQTMGQTQPGPPAPSPGIGAQERPRIVLPPRKKPPKKDLPPRQTTVKNRLMLTVGEIESVDLVLTQPSNPFDDLIESVAGFGLAFGYERLFSTGRPAFSIYAAHHIGVVDRVVLDDDDELNNGAQDFDLTVLSADGLFSLAEIGAGLSWLTRTWRFKVGLSVASLFVQYQFNDLVLSSGANTKWEITAVGIISSFDFEHMTAAGWTIGGRIQAGGARNVEGSRIDAYRAAGYGLDNAAVFTLGFVAGRAF